jgi:hypothetical protein
VKKDRKKLVILLVSIALACMMIANSYADSTITGISNYDVVGKDMGGMEVTFYWTQRGVSHQQTVTWIAGTGNKGFAQVPDGSGGFLFQIRQDNTTYGNPWNVDIANKTGLVLNEFSLNGFNGGIVFDLTSGGDTFSTSQEHKSVPSGQTNASLYGTPGSDRGITFTQAGGPNLTTTVTYSNPVKVEGNAAVGDLFQNLAVVFNTGYTGPSQYAFYADIDKVSISVDNANANSVSAVPLPGAVLLLGASLCRLAAYTRRGKED